MKILTIPVHQDVVSRENGMRISVVIANQSAPNVWDKREQNNRSTIYRDHFWTFEASGMIVARGYSIIIESTIVVC